MGISRSYGPGDRLIGKLLEASDKNFRMLCAGQPNRKLLVHVCRAPAALDFIQGLISYRKFSQSRLRQNASDRQIPQPVECVRYEQFR